MSKLINFGMLILAFTMYSIAPGRTQETQSLPTSNYVIIFDAADRNVAHVTAKISVLRKTIKMTSWGHPWLQHGWATFVEDLVVTDADGNSVDAALVEEDGWGSWNVDVEDYSILNLSYKVKFDHVNYDWDAAGGQDARPEWKGDALYAISRAFFIYSFNDKQSVVELRVPDAWKISSPWEPLDNESGKFFVPSWESLVSNVLVLGDYQQLFARNGEMDIIIALDPELSDYANRIERTLQMQLDAYSKIFNGVPDVTYVIGMRAADEDDGESFFNSFSQVIEKETLATKGSEVIWANTLGHEMFHFWNGNYFLQGVEKSNVEWFGEGFTEYYSSLTLLRAGIISEDLYLKKLERYLTRYFITSNMWPEERISLVQAGEDKSKNWLRIYGGGAVMALALDLDIRKRTNGEKSLDDVMLALKTEFGEQGLKFTVDEIRAAVNSVSGASYDEFFQQYITSAEGYLEITPYLESAGLELQSRGDEFYISKASRPDRQQRKLYRAWVSGG